VSRGAVVHSVYKPPGSKVQTDFNDALLEKVSPGGRIIAFYVDGNTNELVADAVKFKVDPACRGQKVITFSKMHQNGQLTYYGLHDI